jgi:hypothetical protein
MFEGSAAAPLELPRHEPAMRGCSTTGRLICWGREEGISAVGALHWQMHRKVSTPRGRAIYRRRKVIVAPVFGQIKQAMGFRRFSLRGAEQGGSRMGDRVPMPQHAQASPSPRRAQAQRCRCVTPQGRRHPTPATTATGVPSRPERTRMSGCSGARGSCLGSSRGAAALPSNMTRHDGARPDHLPAGQFPTGS